MHFNVPCTVSYCLVVERCIAPLQFKCSIYVDCSLTVLRAEFPIHSFVATRHNKNIDFLSCMPLFLSLFPGHSCAVHDVSE